MKFIVLLFSALLVGTGAQADLANDLQGNWRYDGFFYQGHRYPNPNPDLKLTFTFNADNTARLYWKRDNENGFCERKGTWSLQGDVLIQTTTWLNPANDSSCGQDSDMQMGRMTQNQVTLTKDQLSLHMDLNGQEFLYILIRIGQ